MLAALLIAGAASLLPVQAFCETPPLDNSAINVRDRADNVLTATDQSNAPADLAITTRLRKFVVEDPYLSVSGRNVKIITIAGVVTLRGPVKNTWEKVHIGTAAARVEGVVEVDNQIDVPVK